MDGDDENTKGVDAQSVPASKADTAIEPQLQVMLKDGVMTIFTPERSGRFRVFPKMDIHMDRGLKLCVLRFKKHECGLNEAFTFEADRDVAFSFFQQILNLVDEYESSSK